MQPPRVLLSSVLVLFAAAGCASATDPGLAEGDDPEQVGQVNEALGPTYMQPGEILFPNQSIWSSNCNVQLVMQTDGNLIVRTGSGGFVWQSHTAGNTWAFATLQGGGNFVIYPRDGGPAGTALWSTPSGGSRLVMQSDGNLVLKTASNALVWASGTVFAFNPNCPGNRVSVDTRLMNNTLVQETQFGAIWDLPSFGACGAKCSTSGVCNGWTWQPRSGTIPAKCFLTTGSATAVPFAGLTSGVVQRKCVGNCG